MPKKGENIYKRKDGRWEGRFAVGRTSTGRLLYKSIYAHSYHEAKEKIIRIREQHYLTSDTKYMSAKITLNTVADEWLQTVESSLKESSYIKYRNIVFKHILPHLGAIPMQKMTLPTLKQYFVKLSSNTEDDTAVSNKTAANVLSVLRQILRFSQMTFNFMPLNLDNIKIKTLSNPIKILDENERQILIAGLLSTKNRLDTGILLTLFTGMRIGELCALKNENISLARKLLYIDKTMQRIQNKNKQMTNKTKIIITSPKSISSIREIPLPSDIVLMLEQTMRHEDNDAYFLTGSCEYFIEPRHMQNHFCHVLKKLGLRKVNFHVLRHTFATQCIDLGVDIKSLSEILGHSNVNTTLNRYVHPSWKSKQKNMERLNRLLAVNKSSAK